MGSGFDAGWASIMLILNWGARSRLIVLARAHIPASVTMPSPLGPEGRLFPLADAPHAFGVYVAANMTYPRDEVVSGAAPASETASWSEVLNALHADIEAFACESNARG